MCWYYGSLILQRGCVFGKTVKQCLIDLTLQVKLDYICGGHIQGLYKLFKVICIYK